MSAKTKQKLSNLSKPDDIAINEVSELSQRDELIESDTPAAMKVALVDAKNAQRFTEPKAINTPFPIYPANAYSNRLAGKIKVDFVISEEGRVTDVTFERGTPWIFIREMITENSDYSFTPVFIWQNVQFRGFCNSLGF